MMAYKAGLRRHAKMLDRIGSMVDCQKQQREEGGRSDQGLDVDRSGAQNSCVIACRNSDDSTAVRTPAQNQPSQSTGSAAKPPPCGASIGVRRNEPQIVIASSISAISAIVSYCRFATSRPSA